MESSAKKRVLEAIEQLPADATIEDAMERLYFLAQVERGLADAEAGRLIEHEEARRGMAKRAVDSDRLRELPIAERLRLVKDLWDTIAADAPDEALPVSPELQAEFDRRLAAQRSDPPAARPWEEVRSEILRERGRRG